MKVLHVHPKIGIGGVETYLCRLIGEQVRLGHTVGLLTAGGVFEERVTATGGRLFLIPPRKEHLESALEAIAPHHFDLIHAHNYRAARFARALAARAGARYLMSVHGPRWFWHRLLFRGWSDSVIAMSEGDRDNITSLGGISRRRVHLSFYGIDTDRFRPGIETHSLRAELGLPEDALPLVYISRFAHQKAGVALELLRAMPRICAAEPRAILLLVGEGPMEDQLRAGVEQVNRQVGRRAAILVGPRRDIERVMNLGTLVIAAANTALEAIACGAPTLAAGRTGYFGQVTVDNLEAARAVCFADHGRLAHRATEPHLARGILEILSNRIAAQAAAAELSALVADRYNVARMAEDIEGVYQRLLNSRGTPSQAASIV